jgi:hypothetical protein
VKVKKWYVRISPALNFEKKKMDDNMDSNRAG